MGQSKDFLEEKSYVGQNRWVKDPLYAGSTNAAVDSRMLQLETII